MNDCVLYGVSNQHLPGGQALLVDAYTHHVSLTGLNPLKYILCEDSMVLKLLNTEVLHRDAFREWPGHTVSICTSLIVYNQIIKPRWDTQSTGSSRRLMLHVHSAIEHVRHFRSH